MKHLRHIRESWGEGPDYDPPDPEAEIEIKESDKVFKVIGFSNDFSAAKIGEDRPTLRLPKADVHIGMFALLFKKPSLKDLWICDLGYAGIDFGELMQELGYWTFQGEDPTDDWDDNADGLEGILSECWNNRIPPVNGMTYGSEDVFGSESEYPIKVVPAVPDIKPIEWPEDRGIDFKSCCKIETVDFAKIIHKALMNSFLKVKSDKYRTNKAELGRMIDVLGRAFPL